MNTEGFQLNAEGPQRHQGPSFITPSTPLDAREVRINTDRFAEMPHALRPFLRQCWIVGGGARWLCDLEPGPPRDWDLVVPLKEWSKNIAEWVSVHIPTEFSKLGAFKLKDFCGPGIHLDIWPMDLETYWLFVIDHMKNGIAVHAAPPRRITMIVGDDLSENLSS